MKQGNSCLFCLLKVFNVLFLLSAMGLIAVGIWLWAATGAFNFIDILIISVGAAEFIITVIGISSRRSLFGMRVYNVLLWIVFGCQAAVTIVGFILKEKIIKQIEQKTNSKISIDKLRANVEFVVYYVLGSLAVMFILLVISALYKRSLFSRNTDYRYKVLDQDLGTKISLQEKRQKDNIQAADNADQRRKNLYSQFPQYQKWRNTQGKP